MPTLTRADFAHAASPTAAIQRALDAAAADGGGVVTVPPGTYDCASIFLRDHVVLDLAPGAVLRCVPDIRAFATLPWHRTDDAANTPLGRHFLIADGVTGAGLSGLGAIDGHGTAFYPPAEPWQWPRPADEDSRLRTLVEIRNSRDVTIDQLTLRNASGWTLHLNDCERVSVRGLIIRNPFYAPNSDGIDVTGCSNVIISDCHIDTGDDGIVLKTWPTSRPIRNVLIANCLVRTHCAAYKCGASEAWRDMRGITIANCQAIGSHRALALYSTRGATIEDVQVSNLICDTNVALRFARPIHLDLRRWNDAMPLGRIRNVQISGFSAVTDGRIVLSAEAGARLEDIRLRDVFLRYPVIEHLIGADRTGGAQFSNRSPWARSAAGALVAEHADLDVDGLTVRWPDGPIPEAWRHERRMVNGDTQVYAAADFHPAITTPVAAMTVRGCRGEIRATGLTGFAGAPAIDDPEHGLRQRA